jgi:SAM-dependent methyltransferase
MTATYDTIGRQYRARRAPDKRIGAQIERALSGASSVLNVGAGTGSYEPAQLAVTALEPSAVMIAQREGSAAPVIQGVVEQLPFTDASFDAVMGVLTMHHWSDWRAGLREAARVARKRLVFFTWTGHDQRYWLEDYLPSLNGLHDHMFPTQADLSAALPECEIRTVPIPGDCSDGFLCAYWRRPEAYLDAAVRNSISTFSLLPPEEISAGLQRLQADLDSGEWQRRYSELQKLSALDCGYVLVAASHF